MEQTKSKLAILGIGTAVPSYILEQGNTARRIADALKGQPDSARWARRIFKQCGVDRRYTCEPNLLAEASESRYMPSESALEAPTTMERMELYKKESVPLALAAARQAIVDGQVEPHQITHLITVSCTGQFLPGLDAVLAKELGLLPHVYRFPLTFVGCAAGLKAISLSKQLAKGNADARILIVCVELCTLHIQPSGDRTALFGASFFGDGASACVVGQADKHRQGTFQLGDDHTVLLPIGEEEMVWEVGNQGFELYLSPNIPKLIRQWIPGEVERLCKGELPQLWAIHPGGRGIVEELQAQYGLSQEQVEPSLGVLREFGNVSSATILFVLAAMRKQLVERGSGTASGLAMAFGPGLTAELIRFDYVPASAEAFVEAFEESSDGNILETAIKVTVEAKEASEVANIKVSGLYA